MSALTRSPTYRPDIDGLRAIAVLAVIGYHMSPFNIRGGFTGVDVFFVISGFLITGQIAEAMQRSSFSLLDFYIRRIRRIFPALILVSITVMSIGWFKLLPIEYALLGKHAAAGASFISNLVFWSESGYFEPAAEQKILLHLWSLGIEEQFYFLWPLACLALLRFRRAFAALLVAGILCSFAANIFLTDHDPSAAFFLPFGRAWELLLGCVLALLMRNGYVLPPSPAHLASLAGLLMIAGGIVFTTGSAAFPGWWVLLPTAGSALVILAGPHAWLNLRLLSQPALVFIGLISYPLYLWHWPLLIISYQGILPGMLQSPVVLAFDGFAASRPDLVLEGAYVPRLVRFAVVALSFTLAWGTYALLERPVRRARSRLVPLALCAGVAAVAICGLAIFLRDGVPGRFPAALERLNRYETDYLRQVNGYWRADRCFLAPGQASGNFSAACVDTVGADGPLVMLWGDSHAAALFAGMATLRDRYGFRIAQYTASACAPMLNQDIRGRPHCRGINDFVMGQVQAIRPDLVVLHADWIVRRYTISHLEETLAALRQVGQRNILILGAVPHWEPILPLLLMRRLRLDGVLPERLPTAKTAAVAEANRQLADMAAQYGAAFLAPTDMLCNPDGCLTFLGAETTAFDESHLTTAGAEQVARGLYERFIRKAP